MSLNKIIKPNNGNYIDLAQTMFNRAIASPADAASLLKNLVKTYEDLHKIDESEKTKRVDIECQRQIALAQIGAQKDILCKYLENAFAERKEVFDKIFNVVDDALSKRDNQQLAIPDYSRKLTCT